MHTAAVNRQDSVTGHVRAGSAGAKHSDSSAKRHDAVQRCQRLHRGTISGCAGGMLAAPCMQILMYLEYLPMTCCSTPCMGCVSTLKACEGCRYERSSNLVSVGHHERRAGVLLDMNAACARWL